MPKVRITKAPSTGSSRVRVTGLPNQIVPPYNIDSGSAPAFEIRRTLKSVPEEDANIEAEAGETVYMPDKGGLPAHYNIGGNRHSSGGTHLNVPKDSFVFSDTKKMRIKDKHILADFGKPEGSYTPAEIAKKYDINKFRKQLQDPDSDPIMVSTAEKMISNYNLKLGKLGLIQESKKGFPQGIPAVSMPYLATYNISPDSILPLKAEEQMTQDIPYEEVPQARWGGVPKAQTGNFPGQDPASLKAFYESKEAEKARSQAALKKYFTDADNAKKAEMAKLKMKFAYDMLERASGKKEDNRLLYSPLPYETAAADYEKALNEYRAIFPSYNYSGIPTYDQSMIPYDDYREAPMPTQSKRPFTAPGQKSILPPVVKDTVKNSKFDPSGFDF